MENFKQKLHNISCFVFDVDGVLTDGSLILLQTGEQARTMNIRDGYALQLAVKKGYRIVIISGGKSEAVKTRLNGLGIEDVFLGIEDKISTLKNVISKNNLVTENILYMGDDLPDIAPMKLCGIASCPADAATEIKEISIYVSDKKGGEGCVRDVIEQTMRLHGKWGY
ncbi:MAG: HAD-IIIA family hydrolase [Bacteroidetes bacterium]|nr:HAD-IIIA family hydrolase [Bacteroidota bacterium]